MKKYDLDYIQEKLDIDYDAFQTDSDLDDIYWKQVDIIGHTNPYYRMFYDLVKELEPNFIVELGAWRAYASLHMAKARPECQVVTIDIHKDEEQKKDKEICIKICNSQSNLDYINKWSWDSLPDVRVYKKPIDILFIDAWHDYRYAKLEWETYRPYLSNNALVICDDITDGFEGMLDFWKEMPNPKILNEKIHPGSVMGFVIYQRKFENNT